MKKLSVVFLLLLPAVYSFAQVDPVGDYNRHVLSNWKGDYIRISQYRVKGTPYFLGESFLGTIDYKGGKSVTGVKVLYDLYTQKAGIELANDEIFEEENGIEQFTLQLTDKHGSKKLLFKNADLYDSNAYKGYFNVLEDGSKLTLLKAYRIQLATDPTNNLSKDVRVFDQYYTYYLYNKKTKELRKIKLREKDLLKDMGDNKQVKAFMKDNEIDLLKEDDAIKVLNFYNNLDTGA